MIYFDTSYILKCYLNEPQAEKVRALAERDADKYCCRWGRVEFFSGIKRQLREGKLTPEQAAEIQEVFCQDETDGVWLWLPVDHALLDAVCAAFQNLPPAVPLRAGDALHLTCAREHGFKEIYSSDKHLLTAAPQFGPAGRNVLP